ncbi:Cytoplasmic dynein 2 light intermediate chain 1 [Bulinus truncatus]|nr:Cytoplasmic dynein 2 light intermediate chain 1 [Bulinus truncatus]
MDKSLWDIAVDQTKTKKDERSSSEESTVIVLGSKNSGKTSIILRFLDRDEPPKPTVALEYTFGRKSKGHNIGKDVGHIYELGGGTWLSKLLDIPINSNALLHTSLILVLDLSTPSELWYTMETLLLAARSRLNEVIKESKVLDPQIENKLIKKAWERIGEEHPDKNMINPFLIPIVIVGSKYDIFQDFDSEKRKTICKTLRFLAHIHGSSLQFFSTKQEQLVSRMKSIFSFYLFDTSASKTIQVDHNKPIFVSAGQDALQQIGTPPLKDEDVGKAQARNPMELWKIAFAYHFPQTHMNNPSMIEDPAKDSQFLEPAIDTLRIQKDEELERYKKLAERRSKEMYQNDYIAA